MADDREHDRFLGLDREDADFAKKTVGNLVLNAVTWPLQCVKTLIQLGHEPFPLSTGRVFVCAGRNAYFLPNAFSYGRQLATQQGFTILYTGLDAASVALITNKLTTRCMIKYIDKNYPEIGGIEEVPQDAEEKDLTDHQSFKRQLRNAIRESVVVVAATVVSRPFTVIAIRQIGQLIGKEVKYGSVFSSLKIIGNEEGPAGLFSGLVPQIVGNLVIVWGVHALGHIADRALVHAGVYEEEDEQSKKNAKDLGAFLNIAVPYIVNSWSYPYTVVSTVMAVAGSGLAVSVLPYSPSFGAWQNAFDYLSPSGLKRGSRLFLREQIGAVSVGADQQLYASNKHFV
ncbi:unnamed protein product [Auanema sp. JU1783]|nr:unnamed protein product [Auanema sp. JU1783]